MQTTIQTKLLSKSLSELKKVINPSNNVPILTCFLLEFEKGLLSITASDLEVTQKIVIPIQSEEIGTFALPSGIFSDIVKNISDPNIGLVTNEENPNLEIITSNGTYSIPKFPSEEYPKTKEFEVSNSIKTISTKTLSDVLDKAIKFTGNDELRPILTSINIKIENGILTTAATDAHRLIKYQINNISESETFEFNLSKKTALTLLSACQQYDGLVTINFNETNALFEVENQTIVGRLIDGNYPNYNAVIPSNINQEIHVNRAKLLDSIKRISIFSNKETKTISFDLRNNNEIIIKSADVDNSTKGHESIFANSTQTDLEIVIGFNSRILIEILSAIDSDVIKMNFVAPNRAVLIYPDTVNENESILMLIMPVLLNN